MSEYIEREAAKLRIFEYGVKHRDNANIASACENLERQISSIPAADVREVKRCKDCIYAYPYGLEIKCTKHSGHSEKFGEDASYSEFHDWNWFCADAQERRKK